MSGFFPFREETEDKTSGPQIIEIEDEVADDVFQALSSNTARAILSQLYKESKTASDLAQAVDISPQNTHYHLERLESAGLIESVDTWHSSRGKEMPVYAPTSDPLVVAAGTKEKKSFLRKISDRLLVIVFILALASLLINRVVQHFNGPRIGFSDNRPTAEAPRTSTETSSINIGTPVSSRSETTSIDVMTPPSSKTSTTCGKADATGQNITPSQEASCPTATASNTTEKIPTTSVETSTPSLTETTPSTDTPTSLITTAIQSPSESADLFLSVPSSILFFLGGILASVIVVAWWYWE